MGGKAQSRAQSVQHPPDRRRLRAEMREPSPRAARRRTPRGQIRPNPSCSARDARAWGESPRVPWPLLVRGDFCSRRCAGLAATALLQREARERAVRCLESSTALCSLQGAAVHSAACAMCPAVAWRGCVPRLGEVKWRRRRFRFLFSFGNALHTTESVDSRTTRLHMIWPTNRLV